MREDKRKRESNTEGEKTEEQGSVTKGRQEVGEEEQCRSAYIRNTVNLITDKFATICMCVYMGVCVTSGLLAYRSMVLSCVSTCICVCVCPAELVCLRPPGFRSVSVGTNRSALGLRSKKCLQWACVTSWRMYLYQCLFCAPFLHQ